jgi:hypothetical protein
MEDKKTLTINEAALATGMPYNVIWRIINYFNIPVAKDNGNFVVNYELFKSVVKRVGYNFEDKNIIELSNNKAEKVEAEEEVKEDVEEKKVAKTRSNNKQTGKKAKS